MDASKQHPYKWWPTHFCFKIIYAVIYVVSCSFVTMSLLLSHLENHIKERQGLGEILIVQVSRIPKYNVLKLKYKEENKMKILRKRWDKLAEKFRGWKDIELDDK